MKQDNQVLKLELQLMRGRTNGDNKRVTRRALRYIQELENKFNGIEREQRLLNESLNDESDLPEMLKRQSL